MEGSKKDKEDLLDVLITLKDIDGRPVLSAEEIKAQIVVSLSLSHTNTHSHMRVVMLNMALEINYEHLILHILSAPVNGDDTVDEEEPLKFKPERHLKDGGSEVGLSDPEPKMFSFSTGRRGCAGVTLGSTMTAMLLARLLQGFTWKLPPSVSSTDLRLRESEVDLSLAHPLLALAQPLLGENLYLAA
ncbi:unnamed protein product [Ilex paraguariensis]|uniref:Uncharacterized protein n=1 Tax=Ilex paraguariensis TaxID=185542 RepID=A0ABC8UMX5_9AQUA